MTGELLEQYCDIVAEIQDIEEELRTEVTDTVQGSPEFPYSVHAISITGISEAGRKRRKLEKLREQKREIESFVSNTPHSRQRRILTLRIIKGYTWKVVAAKMGHRYSEESVRKIYQRIIEKI